MYDVYSLKQSTKQQIMHSVWIKPYETCFKATFAHFKLEKQNKALEILFEICPIIYEN